jgi:hypothetical protein
MKAFERRASSRIHYFFNIVLSSCSFITLAERAPGGVDQATGDQNEQ